jgi:hypothetical protein
LILMSEFKKHHIRHMSYGLGLLLIMGTLMYSLTVLLPQVTII